MFPAVAICHPLVWQVSNFIAIKKERLLNIRNWNQRVLFDFSVRRKDFRSSTCSVGHIMEVCETINEQSEECFLRYHWKQVFDRWKTQHSFLFSYTDSQNTSVSCIPLRCNWPGSIHSKPFSARISGFKLTVSPYEWLRTQQLLRLRTHRRTLMQVRTNEKRRTFPHWITLNRRSMWLISKERDLKTGNLVWIVEPIRAGGY